MGDSFFSSSSQHRLHETDTSLTLSLDVPGVKGKDLQVETKVDKHRYRHRILEISGTRKMMGGSDVTFVRGFTIDERVADVSNMTANLADGVLVVTVPKCTQEEEAKPRTIVISENPHPEVSTDTTQATSTVQEEAEGDVDVVLVSKEEEEKQHSLSGGTTNASESDLLKEG